MTLHGTKKVVGAAMLALALLWPATPSSAVAVDAAAAESTLVTEEDTVAMQQALQAEALRRTTLTGVPSICYTVHMQNIPGWLFPPRCDGQIAGTTGENRQIEAFLASSASTTGICYRAHVQTIGWQTELRCDGEMAGTMGGNLQLEAFTMNHPIFRICYEAHVQNLGWQGQRCDGQTAGTVGQNRQIEALAIDLK